MYASYALFRHYFRMSAVRAFLAALILNRPGAREHDADVQVVAAIVRGYTDELIPVYVRAFVQRRRT